MTRPHMDTRFCGTHGDGTTPPAAIPPKTLDEKLAAAEACVIGCPA